MRFKELDRAIVVLGRLLDSRIEGDNYRRLRAAQRELQTIRRGGKLDQRRIGRAVAEILAVFEEEVLTTLRKR
jgi:hypothetical protein